jgi:hypothetical protein
VRGVNFMIALWLLHTKQVAAPAFDLSCFMQRACVAAWFMRGCESPLSATRDEGWLLTDNAAYVDHTSSKE